MDRRQFIGFTAAGGIGLSGSAKFSQAQLRRQPAAKASGGLSLAELLRQYRRDLFDGFLPFMDRYVIDHELGGFMCYTDYTGKHQSENKSSWFEGRGTWVYAFLYNNLARNKKYLDVARRSTDLVLKSKPASSETLWAKELSRDGKPITGPDMGGALRPAQDEMLQLTSEGISRPEGGTESACLVHLRHDALDKADFFLRQLYLAH